MIDITNKDHFLNRELSWIEFNARVLAEAMDTTNPLLERLKFIGIVSSNFDEFFMVRIPSQDLSSELARQIRERANALIKKQNEYFATQMIPEMEAAGIQRIAPQALTDRQLEFVRNLFQKEIFPTLTPIAIAEEKPVPVLVNQTLYMAVALSGANRLIASKYAVVEIPRNFPRMISLPSEKGFSFMLLEDVIALFSKELFVGYEVVDRGLMRITRAAEMSLDEETDEDFAQVMAKALRGLHQSDIVRLEISASEDITAFFKKQLALKDAALCPTETWMDLKGISQFAFQPVFEELKRPAWKPKPSQEFENADDLWELIKKKDVFIMQPYESFEAVTRFISEAANDPDVLAIKQTLYRTGQDSAIIAALERAAEKGKRVTVLVELKARFDEEKNIAWARRLQQAGASVIYGVVGLKTHAKACLVVRREPDGIKRYFHLSTGNYNEKTAQIYSDIGFFSSREEIAADLTSFFNMITGYSQPLALSKLVVAPYGLRRKIKQLINREAQRSTPEKPGLILAKMNSLVDHDVIESLYKASQAGVHIKLNVRGVCCLKPGVKGLSENIEVTSVVDMFLEHSRIFYFGNGGEDELYLSSADWMPRNFDRRIELMFPIESKEMKAELTDNLKAYFKDNVKSWKLESDGSYQKVQAGEKKFRVQEFFVKRYTERAQAEKTIPKELKPQKPRTSS